MDQPSSTPRELTLDEAMACAVECLKNGQMDEAEVICRKILEVAPDHPDAVHYSGMLAYKRGRREDAMALMARSLELAPDEPDWHSNLGIILQAQADLDGAIACFERAITLRPSHAKAHNNLGVLLRILGRHVEAEAEYREAIALNPDYADAYHNLAILLSLTDRTPEAVTAYCTALTLKPQYPEARRLLVLAYCAIGKRDKALTLCEEWVKNEPDDPVARHALASVSGRDVPARASDSYVQKVFDSFSTSFEVKLARLHYRAPELVAAALADSGIAPVKSLDVLDVGCGTGLCGALFAPYARRIIGVDLSSGMLEHAREKHVYDDLVQAELTAYLGRHREVFDVVVSADTLVYFGPLEEVVSAAAMALRPGGSFIFTLEESTAPDIAAPYCLQPHGRYNHRAEYVERLLADAGLVAHIGRAELRMEQGLPVAGLVVRATKPLSVSSNTERDVTVGQAIGEQHA